jgi:hypothetical protein
MAARISSLSTAVYRSVVTMVSAFGVRRLGDGGPDKLWFSHDRNLSSRRGAAR